MVKKISGRLCTCDDCEDVLMTRSIGLLGGGSDRDWFMVKDAVWRAATRGRQKWSETQKSRGKV